MKNISVMPRRQQKKIKHQQMIDFYKHTDKVSNCIGAESYWAMIHQEIPVHEAMQIEDGAKAMNKEWDKLQYPTRDDKGEILRPAAWDVTKVESKGVVMQRARDYNATHKTKKEVHFGSIKALCHIKNFERAKIEWQYKGRIVFRGDLVKDETGYKAVFTEQSTCASYMTGTKFLDIIARFPGCIGEDADATSAFTQIAFDEAIEILCTRDMDSFAKKSMAARMARQSGKRRIT